MGDRFTVLAIGSSAGGMPAISKLVEQFTLNMEMAVMVVIHLSEKSVIPHIVQRLQDRVPFECVVAEEGLLIEPRKLYVALPGDHMLVKDGRILLGQGPEENRWRPSIDVLFRSVATAYGAYAIGVILTGLLNDGTAGMLAIKKCGGKCIVQEPAEAEFPDMPTSVITHVAVDYVLPINRMGEQIKLLLAEPKLEVSVIPEDIAAESEIAEKFSVGIDTVAKLGENTIFGCPDCGGGLWEMKSDELHRYRCHIGHMYSEADLIIKQSEKVQSTLWVALRMMEERRMLMIKLADNGKKKGFSRVAEGYFEKSVEIEVHIERLKELLYNLHE